MSRRNRARKAEQSDKRTGIILGTLGVILIISLAGLVWWFKEMKDVLDPLTMCPKKGPYLVHVLLFDQSDPISPQQALAVRQKIDAIKDSAKPGYRFDIYSFEGDAKNVLTPILSICSPGRKEDANELYQNPDRFRKRYEEKFSPALDKVVSQLLEQSKRPNSPIVESLKAASLSSFGPIRSEATKLRVTMISDMIQNTAAYSHLKTDPNFQQLSKSAAWPTLRPDLKGAEVDIVYLLRPEAKRAGATVQNQGHQLFWEQLIRASGGQLMANGPI